MELVEAMKGTGADEGELHQLAKDMVLYADDQAKVQKLYDDYLENKTDDIKNAFLNNYMNEKRTEHVKNRVATLLGYYLTKEQIRKVRLVLEREVSKGSTQEQLIAAVKDEVAKEIGEKKAEIAVDRAIKDLRILGKRYVGWLEKAEKMFFSLIKHDEH
ncbi:hypothetical protein OESDEN_11159 [Oesophagostomum dentatum]|uniref:Uncharacterized protein n=1 Tax=Oesophagostomum dentatum TaxID=61180 RepID=A0A0B1SYP7_OESDE|nr:hypothetical protein OESDEN_11159 [Oesophagostomum dentatum]